MLIADQRRAGKMTSLFNRNHSRKTAGVPGCGTQTQTHTVCVTQGKAASSPSRRHKIQVISEYHIWKTMFGWDEDGYADVRSDLKEKLATAPSWPWSLSSYWLGFPSRSKALAPRGSHQCWVAMKQSIGNIWIPTDEVKHEAFNALRRRRSVHLSDNPPLPAATRWQSVTRIGWFSCQSKWQDLCIYQQLSCKIGSDEVLPSLLVSTSFLDGSGAEAGSSLWL